MSRFAGHRSERIHGDFHWGNLLFNRENQAFLLDFDDTMLGHRGYDFFLFLRAPYDEAKPQLESILEGYREWMEPPRMMRELWEVFRIFRTVAYTSWIFSRFDTDESFRSLFPQFRSDGYWQSELDSLSRALESLNQPHGGAS
jgi:Ser/Thr protein kinase RdoA (MazF antagonist)